MTCLTTVRASGDRASWSPGFVAEAALHPMNVRLYANSPYLREIYDSLPRGAVHPADVRLRELAHPLMIRRGRRDYFLPGSADDLLLYTSCVVACCPAIIRSLPADFDAFDYAPPLIRELSEGSFGQYPLSVCYWNRMKRASQQYFDAGYSYVLFTDISRCSDSVDIKRMLSLLTQAHTDAGAVRILEQMHRSWLRAGCRGLPLTGGSRVLFKLYMRGVDERMRKEGIAFLRFNDDFRLFCRAKEGAREVFSCFEKVLASAGFAANKSKTHLFSCDELHRAWKARKLDWMRTLNAGVVMPALSEALRFRLLRPSAYRLLRLFYGSRCMPA